MDLHQAPTPQRFDIEQGGETVPFVAVPNGWDLKVARDPELTPRFIKAFATAADSPSFKRYLDRFSNERTLVAASRRDESVTAVLDYHKDADTPSPCRHTLTRKYLRSRRFQAWTSKDGRRMSQVEFAEFLEDRLKDVVTPDQATLHTSVVSFKAHRTATCVSATNLTSGDIKFEYTQETKNVGGSAVLPERIEIRVPVFEFERDWVIPARLRYRLNEGRLEFWYDLIDIDELVDEAFRLAVSDLSKLIGQAILLAD